jgi:hypothetical protein
LLHNPMTLETTNDDAQRAPVVAVNGSKNGVSHVIPAPDTPDKPTSPFSCPATDALVIGVKKAVVLFCTGTGIDSTSGTSSSSVVERQSHEVDEQQQLCVQLTARNAPSAPVTYGSTAGVQQVEPVSGR